GRTGLTPVPPASRGHWMSRPVVPPPPPTTRSGVSLLSLLNPPEDSSADKREPEREPGAFIRLGGPNQGQAPQSARSAEIAQFIDQAFMALQASDPMPDAKLDPASERSPSSPAGLLKLRPPAWPSAPGSSTGSAVAALLSKSSSNPTTPVDKTRH